MCFLTAVLAAAVCFSTPVRGQDWETLEGCRLWENAANDGDSFHVKHGGREYIFRLLYVDCPERKEMGLTERTTEQARYFQITKRDLYPLSGEAAAFTAARLKTPFRVMTRWEDARGDSRLPRYYAVVETGEGGDLATLLVRAGLARIHGLPVAGPGGRSGSSVVEGLKREESAARDRKSGAWAFSRAKK